MGDTLTAADLERTADALANVLPHAIEYEREPKTIDEVLKGLGGTRREAVARAAMALSGSSVKSSRAYLSARRLIERRMPVRGGKQLRGLQRPRITLDQISKKVGAPRLDPSVSLTVRMKAGTYFSRGRGRVQTMPSGEAQYLSARGLGQVRDHLRAGRMTQAAEALLDAFVFAYALGRDRANGVIGSIHWIEIGVDK